MQEEMKLQDYLRISCERIWKNKVLIVAATLIFMLGGILYASWQSISNTYYAKATICTMTGRTLQENSIVTDALSGYSDVANSRKVCQRAESIVGDPNITAGQIKEMINVSSNKSGTIMTITAYSQSPTIAVNVANAVAEAFISEIQSITGSDKIQILDNADEVRMSSNGLKGLISTVLVAGAIGLALSIVISISGLIFSSKIKSVEQCLDEDEEALGIIPFIDN